MALAQGIHGAVQVSLAVGRTRLPLTLVVEEAALPAGGGGQADERDAHGLHEGAALVKLAQEGTPVEPQLLRAVRGDGELASPP